MDIPAPPDADGQSTHALPRKYWLVLLVGAAFLLGWIFSAYLSPQIMIDFILRYCA